MSLKSASINAPSARTAELWGTIDRTVRESCALRCEGRNDEAAILLQETLPALIREWSSGCGLSAEACRADLRQLFTQAQERVATAQLCKRLMRGSLGDESSAPTLAAAPAHSRLHLRRRIPIDDIAGMLDALDENNRDTRPHRKNFHAISSTPLFPALAVA